MSKSILVIDTPKNCKGCLLHRFVLDEVLNEWFVNCQLDTFVDEDENRPSQCPLKPLPQPREMTSAENYNPWIDENAIGFNQCLAEIIGETE